MGSSGTKRSRSYHSQMDEYGTGSYKSINRIDSRASDINNKFYDIRIAAAFWLSGLLNNSGYVIMLAAAKHIMDGSVGIVYLADVLPTFFIKVTLPYWQHLISYKTRLWIAVILYVISFVTVASSNVIPIQ